MSFIFDFQNLIGIKPNAIYMVYDSIVQRLGHRTLNPGTPVRFWIGSYTVRTQSLG